MIDITLKCVLFHNYVKRLGLSGWKHIAIHQFFFFFIFFLPHLDTVLHFCLMNCQPHCKMLIPSDKHEGKLILPSFNLSLCHVFVRGRSMHIIDIPVACCMTHPSTPLSITHFLSSISPEAESNRAHQTGWSEQNCDWQCPADSPWNSVKPGECTWMRMWTVCAFLCVHVHALVFNCLHASMSVYLFASVCVFLSVYECVFVPLLSAEPPWDEGEEEDDELEEVLCSMASRESSERRRSGLLEQEGKKISPLSKFFKIIQYIYIKQMYAR